MTLILDLTPYTAETTIVYVGILVHSRVLPLCWCLMPQQEQWDREQWDIVAQLFEQIAPFFTSDRCTLIADRGLSCLKLITLCQNVGWHYLLRIKKASPQRVRDYAKRMKVEATFQDQKSRGCMIECSRFTNRDHLNRWLFAVFLSMWWSAHLGSSCVHHGHRDEVDRTDRREKGLLRIGRLWLKAILKKANQALFDREKLSRIKAQLANCLLFSHRQKRLFFSIYIE